jgi:hypothetical protein
MISRRISYVCSISVGDATRATNFWVVRFRRLIAVLSRGRLTLWARQDLFGLHWLSPLGLLVLLPFCAPSLVLPIQSPPQPREKKKFTQSSRPTSLLCLLASLPPCSSHAQAPFPVDVSSPALLLSRPSFPSSLPPPPSEGWVNPPPPAPVSTDPLCFSMFLPFFSKLCPSWLHVQ